MNLETFLALIPTIIAAGGWFLSTRRAAAREAMRRDLTTAFASHNDVATQQLSTELGTDEERLWRRLITTRSTLEESEREQARARRDLEDVLAALQDGVLVVDSETRVRFLNEAALRMFDVRIEDVLGANLIEALPSFGIDAAMRIALREGKSSANEVHLYSPRMREVFLRVSPVFSGAGSETGAVAIVQDLTELRRLERVRRDFVANASHELRTPIASIRAAAETLLHAPDDAALIARFLPPLITEAERISHLVSDLLDLARAESDDHPPYAPVPIAGIVESVVNRLDEKAKRREITVEWQPDGNPYRVMGDAASLEQVIFNLVDNALSYTPSRGQVSLRLKEEHVPQVDDTEPQNVVQVEVSDSGIGIPENDLPRIFERFYRVDKARSRAEGGTGLGLAIVKHIVENHGGHVEVESQVGRGTTFRVELPLLETDHV